MKNNETIKAYYGKYHFKGLFKWGYVTSIFLLYVSMIFLSLYIIFFSEKVLWGIILLGMICCGIRYKNKTWTYIALEKIWGKIKYGY